MADFSQDKKYKYNWQSSKFKDLALSGSNISQFINDAGYVTSSNATSASYAAYAATASYLLGSITSASHADQADNALAIDVYSFSSPVDSYLLMSNVIATTGVAVGGDTDLRYNASTNKLTVGTISATSFTGSLLGTASYAVYAETASFSLATTENKILVLNQSGNTIAKGVVVHITASGNSSDIPRVITASYENDNASANTLGITSQAITNGSQGYVTTEGVITGINTNAFQSGQLVYLGATGSITGSAPLAPLHSVRLGQVIREQSNNGSIYVRIDNGYELGELHDVRDTTTTSSYGDLLVRSGSVWTNLKQLTGSYGLTGSLNATSFTGSLLGTASYAAQALSASFASTVPASGVIGLNLTQIATASFSASVSPTQFTVTSASITEFSVAGNGVTIGNVITDTHRVTGSLRLTGSLGVTGSISLRAYTGSADSVMNITSTSGTQLVKIGGDGTATIGTYTNPSTQLSINSALSTGLYVAGVTGIYAQNQTGTGTAYGMQVLGRQFGSVTPSGYIAYGILTGADTTNGINYGLKSYAYNGVTNYAGYFDATNGTNNYAIVTQRGYSGFGKTDPAAIVDIKAAGALSTDIAFRVRNSADNKNIMEVRGDGETRWPGLAVVGNYVAIKNYTSYDANIDLMAGNGVLARIYHDVDSITGNGNLNRGLNIWNPGLGAGFTAKINNVVKSGLSAYGEGYGFNWAFTSNVSGSFNQSERAMFLTHQKSLVLYTGSSSPTDIFSEKTGSFEMFASSSTSTVGVVPHFKTERGTIFWLGSESRLFNVTASNLILSSSATIGFTSSISTENTLTLGPPPAGGTGEGGQLGLAAAGGSYTSASMIDTWQNQFRVLRGTNASSNAGLMYMDLQNGNTNFIGAVTASGGYSNLPNDYLYVTRNTTQTIGSGTWADRDIIFNNSVVSKGISYNTGTGLATLTAGKVYRITSRLAWSAAAVYLLEFSCYDSSNTQLGPTTQIVQSTNGSNNISDGTLDFIYAPGSNVDIKIRTTANTTALTGESIRGDLNTQLIIQQIA